jgi:hypothetical protein
LVLGISSHSEPAISSDFKKKGQRSVRMASDWVASAEDMGTGEDFIMAVITSDVGRTRRLRVVGVVAGPAGVEKSLRSLEYMPSNKMKLDSHPNTLRNTPKST